MGITLGAIFQSIIAGVVSFASPCVLPLIPAYISYISGETLSDLRGGSANTKKLLINSIAFVLGFSFVFIMLGATATLIGKFLTKNKQTFELVAGLIIIIFGLHTAQIVRFNFLSYEKKLKINTNAPSFIRAFLMGFAFSFGWTPCVGPILGTILVLAGTYGTVTQGIILLTFYSLGLGIPFILTALLINKFFEAFKSIKRYFGQIEMFAGLLIIGIGLSLVFHLGLHSNYIVAYILIALSLAILSVRKTSMADIVGIILLISSIFTVFNNQLFEEGKLNISLVPIYLLLIVGIISMYKVGKQNE